jgi:hypothetical protein
MPWLSTDGTLPQPTVAWEMWGYPVLLPVSIVGENYCLVIWQARVRESLGIIENTWFNITFQFDHALAQAPHSPGLGVSAFPHIDYWTGFTWCLPSYRLVQVFKAPREEKHCLSASRFHLGPLCSLLYFAYLTFNKFQLIPCVLQWILSSGTQIIWKCSDHRLHHHY